MAVLWTMIAVLEQGRVVRRGFAFVPAVCNGCKDARARESRSALSTETDDKLELHVGDCEPVLRMRAQP